MYHAQLQPRRLEEIPEQYRREAALHAELKRAGLGVHPARRRLAAVLRRVADAIEPAPVHPPIHA